MSTLIWQDASGTWNSSANWVRTSDGANVSPASGDTCIVGYGSQNITGSDESATELLRVVWGEGFTGNVGASGSRLKLSADRLEWAALSDAAWIDWQNTHNYTDLAIDASDDTKITSAARSFVADDVGKKIELTGGTGFTTGTYTISSVAGGAAFLDSAVGTTSSTGGTGFCYLKAYIKQTKTIDADEITTKSLHLRLFGDAACEDVKVVGGYVSLSVTVGDDAVWLGVIQLGGTLVHIDGIGGTPLATTLDCLAGTIILQGESGISSSATINIRSGAIFEHHTEPTTFPVTGPIVVVAGGTLNEWDSAMPIGNLGGEAGTVDFSVVKQPFTVQLCSMIDADMYITNGLRQPNFATPIKWRGTGRLHHAGNINTTIEYVE